MIFTEVPTALSQPQIRYQKSLLHVKKCSYTEDHVAFSQSTVSWPIGSNLNFTPTFFRSTMLCPCPLSPFQGNLMLLLTPNAFHHEALVSKNHLHCLRKWMSTDAVSLGHNLAVCQSSACNILLFCSAIICTFVLCY